MKCRLLFISILFLFSNTCFSQIMPSLRGFVSKPDPKWVLVQDITKQMTQGWSDILSATNPSKQYKLVVSGTWGIANSRFHRDAAYDCGSQNTIGVSGTPQPNRGCDANWSFNGSCPPPVPDFPKVYALDNTYTYFINSGQSLGITIAFSDGGYGDNVGSLRFRLYVAE